MVTPRDPALATETELPRQHLFSGVGDLENCDVGGIGGTLAGNALSLAAMRATLTKVLTKEAFERMIPMAGRWTEGVAKAIADAQLPWYVTRLGCRAEYIFGPQPVAGVATVLRATSA